MLFDIAAMQEQFIGKQHKAHLPDNLTFWHCPKK